MKSRHSKQPASLGEQAPGVQPDAVRSCDPAFQHGVVVGFDGSLSSERALAYAVGMARRSRCGLVIVHVANRLPATVWAGCEPPSSSTCPTTAARSWAWNWPARTSSPGSRGS